MDDVILLHGLGRDQKIMQPMAMKLQQTGYQTHNFSYASTQYPVEALAEKIYQKILMVQEQSNAPLHFVLHSLSSLIIRYLLQHYDVVNLGRVVMIAPPNHGSEVADLFKNFKFYQKLYGPAGQELVTGPKGIAARLPAADYELGIIAGDRCVIQDSLFSWFLFKGANDGKVSVVSTRLDGMKQHIILPVSHPMMPCKKVVIEQVAAFIKSGQFQ